MLLLKKLNTFFSFTEDIYDNDWLNVYNETASGDGDTETEVTCVLNKCGDQDGTGNISRSAHRTSNFTNPKFQFS